MNKMQHLRVVKLINMVVLVFYFTLTKLLTEHAKSRVTVG